MIVYLHDFVYIILYLSIFVLIIIEKDIISLSSGNLAPTKKFDFPDGFKSTVKINPRQGKIYFF